MGKKDKLKEARQNCYVDNQEIEHIVENNHNDNRDMFENDEETAFIIREKLSEYICDGSHSIGEYIDHYNVEYFVNVLLS
jgi:hypothetical protein